MMHKNAHKKPLAAIQQNGNVLFLILIAVALFAALSYAVTQSTRGGGNADDETALLDSTTVMQFGASVTAAVQRLMLLGTSETDLCFYTGNNHTDYNHASCADDSNNVFHSDGGGASYQSPPAGINDGTEWEFSSRVQVYGQGATTPVGTGHNAETDLVILLRGMNQNICQKINEEIGVTGIPVDSGDVNVDRFDGDYVQGDNIDGCNPNCTTVADSPFSQAGSHIGCFQESATSDYVYFHTLLAR